METPSAKAFPRVQPRVGRITCGHTHRHCESRLGVSEPFRHPPSGTAAAGGFRERPSVSGEAAAAGCWGTGWEGGRGAEQLPAGEGGFRFWLDLNSSSAGSVGLGDALRLILWPDPACSRPPAQPLVLLCAANPTPSGRSAGLMPHTQMGPGDPVSPSLQAGGDGEHGRAPRTLARRVWDAFEVRGGEPAFVPVLPGTWTGQQGGNTEHGAGFYHVAYCIAGKRSDERVGTDRSRNHISIPGCVTASG